VIIAGFEIQCAVIAANLPSLKAFYMKMGCGESLWSGRGSEGRKGYKLSSFGRSGKTRSERGSITRLERGIMSTESEEESFRQGGTKIDGGKIQVTRDYSVNSAEVDGRIVVAEHFSGERWKIGMLHVVYTFRQGYPSAREDHRLWSSWWYYSYPLFEIAASGHLHRCSRRLYSNCHFYF
jgi:hypothetical protein